MGVSPILLANSCKAPESLVQISGVICGDNFMARFAIVKTGGKQYRVEEGDIIDVELLNDLDGNTEVVFEEVLFLCDGEEDKSESHVVGTPTVPKCVVRGELIGEVRGPKVIAYKFRRRKDSHTKKGHRQYRHRVRITQIEAA